MPPLSELIGGELLQLRCTHSGGYEPWLQATNVSAVRTPVTQEVAALVGRPNAALFPLDSTLHKSGFEPTTSRPLVQWVAH